MSDSPTNPNDPRPWVNKEFEDPQFHDEEQDPTADEPPHEGHVGSKKKRPSSKLPPPLRRFHEE